jgi:hypothetical protein
LAAHTLCGCRVELFNELIFPDLERVKVGEEMVQQTGLVLLAAGQSALWYRQPCENRFIAPESQTLVQF